MPRPHHSQTLYAAIRAHWEVLAVAALAAGIYAPAVHFGIIWDDPTWYRLTEGLKAIQLWGSVPSFHFYRPLALLYSRLFVTAGGIVMAAPQHLLQVAFHTVNVVLLNLLSRRLGLSRWAAAVAMLVFALHPFAQQAVAWQVPPQPLVTLAMLTTVLTAQCYHEQQRSHWLVLSVSILSCALFYQEVTLGVLPMLGLTALQADSPRRGWRRYIWLLWYGLPTALFLTLYLITPKRPDVLGAAQSVRVAAYLVQAVAPPLGMLRSLASSWSSWGWLALLGTWTLFVAWVGWRRRPQAALIGIIWFVTPMAPSILGLSWAYVAVGPRVIYPGLVGVALLWGAFFDAWQDARIPSIRLLSRLAAVALVGMLGCATLQLQRLYQQATAHLRAATEVLAAQPDANMLFLNFPDRIALTSPPYMLGYWGITLAPPVQQLSDYALATEGVSATTAELTRLDVAHGQWDGKPLSADLRGNRIGDSNAMPTDRWYDAVYTTLVSDRGALALRQVGWSASPAHQTPLAQLGESLIVFQGHAELEHAGSLRVKVGLESAGNLLADDALSVQLVDTDDILVRQADQDLWADFVPLSTLPEDVLLGEVRYLDVADLAAGDYAVIISLYNRATGLRYPAVWADGHAVWDDQLQIDTLHVE